MTEEKNDSVSRQKLYTQLQQVGQQLEKFNIAQYLEMLNNPRRYLFVNFAAGLARGLGFAIGFTLLGALVIYFLQRLVVLNLPVIGEFLKTLIEIATQEWGN